MELLSQRGRGRSTSISLRANAKGRSISSDPGNQRWTRTCAIGPLGKRSSASSS